MSEKKKKIGRPTKYKPEYCQEIIDHFNQPLYVYETEEKMSASGAIKEIKVKKANDMPTFNRFALERNVLPDSMMEWVHKYPEFSRAYRYCKGIQTEFITTHALSKNYSEGFSKFFAINNLGMIERSEMKTENEHNVKGYGLAFDLSKSPDEI